MSQITVAQLNAAKIFVGADLDRLEGAAEDFFSIELGSDVGSAVDGIHGDVMLIVRQQNRYNASITLIPASDAVKKLLRLTALGVEFLFKCSFNDFNFTGVAIVQNPGAWVASLASGPRVMTLILVRQSGNVETGIGRLAAV